MVFGGLLPEPSPPYDPGDVKFLYDSNKVFYKLIGSVTIPTGQDFTCEINYYDPDGDIIRLILLAAPKEMTVNPSGPTEYVPWQNDYFGYGWQLSWTPSEVDIGVHYIDVKIEDAPISQDPLTDMGTLLINVVPGNKPPVIGGCSYARP